MDGNPVNFKIHVRDGDTPDILFLETRQSSLDLEILLRLGLTTDRIPTRCFILFSINFANMQP